MLIKLITLSILTTVSLTTYASQIVRLNVAHKADIYEVHVEMEFDAPAEKVRAILTDYANLDRLNESITTSRIIDSSRDGKVRVLTQFENCILFFCMDIQKVEDIMEDEQGRILLVMIPESSNFRSGNSSWEVQSTETGSRVIHIAKLEPDLRIPAWLGSAILKDTLRQEFEKSFDKLECLATRNCRSQPSTSQHDDWDDFSEDI